MRGHIRCHHCGQVIGLSGLPLELQTTEALREAARSVAEALRGDTLMATEIVDAWDYLLSIEAELERRSRLPVLEEALAMYSSMEVQDGKVQDRAPG